MVKVFPCPVCGASMKHSSDEMDGTGVTAENNDCPNLDYYDHYERGASEVVVGNQIWYWSYQNDSTDYNRIQSQIQSAILKQKEIHSGH